MKLFIQIPCLNEEATLPLVLAKIPTAISGIDDIQLMIIDDGCTDRTVEVAAALACSMWCITPSRWGWRAPSAMAWTMP